MKKKTEPESMFVNIKENPEPIVVESLCVNCQDNGKTTLLLTKIPFFRQIIISSFHCAECDHRNNQIQFAGELPPHGIDILFRIMNTQDLNRQIIKSEHATIKIVELGLQIPESKKSEITTIQGLLIRVEEDLSEGQQNRKIEDFQNYEKLNEFLKKIKSAREGQGFPLTLKIFDPSGNSNIKNPFAPKLDKNLQISYTVRTVQELIKMGYSPENAKQAIKEAEDKNLGTKINFTKPFEQNNFMHHEPTIFEVDCHSCMLPGIMKMCQTSIPYFTDITIMSFHCEHCGAHSTQTKNGGQITAEGCTISLTSETETDLKRDLFKSETCSVNIPQIELQLDYGTLGGVYTTVQGLLQKIHDHLKDNNPFSDSDDELYHKMCSLFEDMQCMIKGTKNFTMILRDPLGHSFLQNPYHPEDDPRGKRVSEPRTQEQNEMLGINDMQV